MANMKDFSMLAGELLRNAGVKDAPVDVHKVAKALGVAVRYTSAEDDLCGFLIRDHNQQKAIIGVNKNHHSDRQRFTVAHELGHFMLHGTKEMHLDCGHLFSISLRRESEKNTPKELEANRFAGELLMPLEWIERDLQSIGQIAEEKIMSDLVKPLSKKYKVSTQAMIRRLSGLERLHL